MTFKNKQELYVVYLKWQQAPSMEHSTLELAIEEARRLTKQTWKQSYVARLEKSFVGSVEEINI